MIYENSISCIWEAFSESRKGFLNSSVVKAPPRVKGWIEGVANVWGSCWQTREWEIELACWSCYDVNVLYVSVDIFSRDFSIKWWS